MTRLFVDTLGVWSSEDLVSPVITHYVISCNKVKENHSHYRPEVTRGFQQVKVPRLRDTGPG